MRRWGWIAGAVLLVWAMTATVIALVRSGPPSEVGTWADWTTAAVTFLALLAAAWAGVAAQGQFRSGQGQLEAAQAQLRVMEAESEARSEEARERQARQVFVIHVPYIDGPTGETDHHIDIDNRSSEPISEVEVWLIGPHNRNSVFLGVVPGTSVRPVPYLARKINADVEWIADRLTFPDDEARRSWVRTTAGIARYEFHLAFTDARGQRWLRSADSTLTAKPASFGGQRSVPEVMAHSRFDDGDPGPWGTPPGDDGTG